MGSEMCIRDSVLNGDERSMSGFGQYAEVRHYIYCKETTDEKEG